MICAGMGTDCVRSHKKNQVIFKCGVPEAEEGWDSRILTFALEALAADIRRYESQG